MQICVFHIQALCYMNLRCATDMSSIVGAFLVHSCIDCANFVIRCSTNDIKLLLQHVQNSFAGTVLRTLSQLSIITVLSKLLRLSADSTVK